MARISGSTHICTLVLSLCFLVFEIVVGQICRSLLIAVDSFHTLYVFINLALSALKHHPASPCSPEPSTTAGSSRPDVCASGGLSSPCAEDYRRMRLKPFGVLISALLMASQCVSISLEILTHAVQPEPIQHPLLSIVVGGASLIFNMLVLAWTRSSRGTDEAADGCEDLDDHCVVGSALQDDALMFCNPEASGVLDPDQGSQHRSSELPEPSITEPVQSSQSQKSNSRISESSQEIIPEEPHLSTCTERTVSQCIPAGPGFRRAQLGSVAVIQDLLSSVLVLTNGLVLLLSAAHCHRPHSDCHLLVYLDAGFSAVCVLVLFSTALPRLRRYGLLVLQATPLHLSVAQVRLCLAEVPGVLSVHELHVWQLSEALLVASLHVHCPDGLNAAQCTDLMERIKAVLSAFGINHSTVQPELIRSDGSGRPLCSLRCGQQCAEKLCCSPQLDEAGCPRTQSAVCSPAGVDEHRDVVIENTYL
ncbi:zinc/cadmium resistance protein [Cyprinus carpio]|uniref:Zinc/cadmium resistance protein n=1 Tax=Cyprinus carpio TaxID=7962 RepID=A0A9R0BD73_CYPCA|nr:zinc/cadmium resistance protein [Cyprinus carpio]XP_042630697.1 zinc/cadmium resistance protein [Cyprinus carpio]